MIAGRSLDVMVAGAGPAGVAASMILHQAGVAVCLVDEVDHPARKVGESLPGAILRSLRRLGIHDLGELLAAHEFHPCTANVSAWGEETWRRQEALANPEGGGWHVLRHRFNEALRQRAASAGVEFIARRIRQIHREEEGSSFVVSVDSPTPEILLRARFLVDATGRSATVSRNLGSIRKRVSQQCAAVAWIRSPSDDEDQTTRLKSVANGWWYTARLPGSERVLVFHGLAGDVLNLAQHPDQFFEACNQALIVPYPVAASDLGQAIKTVDASVQTSHPVAGSNWLAVGDAALAFDPLSSQGVLFALYSGIRGAEAILQSLHQSAAAQRIQSEYQQKVENVLAANQRARQHYYTRERRYLENAYWSTQQAAF